MFQRDAPPHDGTLLGPQSQSRLQKFSPHFRQPLLARSFINGTGTIVPADLKPSNAMNTTGLLTFSLAAFLATSEFCPLRGDNAAPPGAANSSSAAQVRTLSQRPYPASTIQGIPAALACATFPTPPRTFVQGGGTAKAAPKPVIYAFSQTQRTWMEVQPAYPLTTEGIRSALAATESQFVAEQNTRRQAEEAAKQASLEQQWARENAIRANRARLVNIAASRPSGAGLAAAVAQGQRPTVITTARTIPCPPPPAPSCINEQVRNYVLGRGPLPKGVTNLRVTRTPTRQ